MKAAIVKDLRELSALLTEKKVSFGIIGCDSDDAGTKALVNELNAETNDGQYAYLEYQKVFYDTLRGLGVTDLPVVLEFNDGGGTNIPSIDIILQGECDNPNGYVAAMKDMGVQL